MKARYLATVSLLVLQSGCGSSTSLRDASVDVPKVQMQTQTQPQEPSKSPRPTFATVNEFKQMTDAEQRDEIRRAAEFELANAPPPGEINELGRVLRNWLTAGLVDGPYSPRGDVERADKRKFAESEIEGCLAGKRRYDGEEAAIQSLASRVRGDPMFPRATDGFFCIVRKHISGAKAVVGESSIADELFSAFVGAIEGYDLDDMASQTDSYQLLTLRDRLWRAAFLDWSDAALAHIFRHQIAMYTIEFEGGHQIDGEDLKALEQAANWDDPKISADAKSLLRRIRGQ